MIKNVIKEFKEEKIEVVSIFDTTYEDGTKWVEYRVNGLVGYELTDDYYNEEDKKEGSSVSEESEGESEEDDNDE